MTDNNPLTYVTHPSILDATSHRWRAALSAYDFKIKYRAGKLNHDADGLFQKPPLTRNISRWVRAILNAALVKDHPLEESCVIEKSLKSDDSKSELCYEEMGNVI